MERIEARVGYRRDPEIDILVEIKEFLFRLFPNISLWFIDLYDTFHNCHDIVIAHATPQLLDLVYFLYIVIHYK